MLSAVAVRCNAIYICIYGCVRLIVVELRITKNLRMDKKRPTKWCVPKAVWSHSEEFGFIFGLSGLVILCSGRLLFSNIAMKFNRTPDRPCGIDLSISPELILLQAAPSSSTNQIMEDKQARNAARACVWLPNSQLMSCGIIWHTL